MKYPYTFEYVQEADGETYWVARSNSLKGCIGAGETKEAAENELEENEISWLETAKEYGIAIPLVQKDGDSSRQHSLSCPGR